MSLNHPFVLAAIITVIFFLIKAIELSVRQYKNPHEPPIPLRDILRDSILVMISSTMTHYSVMHYQDWMYTLTGNNINNKGYGNEIKPLSSSMDSAAVSTTTRPQTFTTPPNF